MKIRTRIALLNSIAFTLALVLISVIMTTQLRSLMTRRIRADLIDRNESAVALINANVTTAVKTHLRSIADANRRLMARYYRMYREGLMSEDEARAAVSETFIDPEYGTIGDTGYLAGVDTQGILVIHPRSPGVDASGFEFMQQAIEMRNGYLEYMWKNSGETEERAKAGWLSYFEPWDIMVWASSYRSEFVDLVSPSDFRDAILNLDATNDGYSYIMRSDGTLVVHPDLEGESLYDAQDADGSFFARSIIDTKDGSIEYSWQGADDDHGREKLAVFAYLPDLDWYVVTTFYRDEVFDALGSITFSIVLAMVVSLLVIIICNVLIGGIVARPVVQMNSVIGKSISQVIDLRTQLSVRSDGEVGELGGKFDSLIERIRDVVKSISDVGVRSTGIGDDLAQSAEQVSSSIVQVSSAVGSFEEQTETLNKEITDTREAVSHVREAVSRITTAIDAQSAAAAESSAATEEMTASIQNVTELAARRRERLSQLGARAEEGKTELQGTADSIAQIAESASAIFSLIEVIDHIASQTNLLSMNAAIEAAHAGDAGKGFAVVAGEIRHLAETTSSSTKDISTSIREILERIETARESSNNSRVRFESILDEVGTVVQSLEQILDGMKEMSLGSAELLTTANELREGNETIQSNNREIVDGIVTIEQSGSNLEQLAVQHLAGIREISSIVSDVSRTAETLRGLGVQNAENITTIEAETAKFVV